MFEHSVKVPQLYKTAAKFARNVEENNVSLESLVYEQKHLNIKAAYALVTNSFKYAKQLEFLFKKSRILEKEPRLDSWLARVLITELVWGKKRLPGQSKPVKTVLAYQHIFNAHSSDIAEPSEEVKIVSIPRYVRVNTLIISVNEAVERFRNEGWIFVRFMDTKNYSGFLEKVANLGPDEFMVDIHVKELLIFPPNTQFYNHSAWKNGLILLQDKASCLPVHLLDPKPETTVLDMCAAPGMKTSQIACKLENKGKIYAVDLNLQRLKAVDKLTEKCGITCVTTINNDILNIKDRECPNVEYILVDPSCSGSGMVNRLELIKKGNDDEGRIQKLFGFQVMILKHAFRHFPKVKRVIYSTCSLNSKENEGVIQEVIMNCSAFKLVDAKKLIPNWNNFGSEEFGEIGKRCLYSRPEQDYTNGFFVAIFEKLQDGEVNEFLITNKIKENEAVNKKGLQERPETRKNTFQDIKLEEEGIDCNMNKVQEQEIYKSIKNNQEMSYGIQYDNKETEKHTSRENKKCSLKSASNQIVTTQILREEQCTYNETKRRRKKNDAVEVQKYEDSENVKTLEGQSKLIDCQKQENILNEKKHEKKKCHNILENLYNCESVEVRKEEEENCDIPQSIKRKKTKRKSSLVEEMDSTPKTMKKDKRLNSSNQLANKESDNQTTHSLKKKKNHNTENYLKHADVINSENSEEKQSVVENSSDYQTIKRKKRQKHASIKIQEDSDDQLSTRKGKEGKRKCPSLIEEAHSEPQGARKKKTKNLSEDQLLGTEEGQKLVTKECGQKKYKAETNIDGESAIDGDNLKEQFRVYENNSSPNVKGRQKLQKSIEIGEKGGDLHHSMHKQKKDKKKHRPSLGTKILIKEQLSYKETGEDDLTRQFSNKKQNEKVEKKLNISEISNDNFESHLEKKKRQQQLNEDNSLIRESLSDFLQTLSSSV